MAKDPPAFPMMEEDLFISSRFAASHTGIETAHRAVSLVALLLVPFQISPSLKCKTKRTPAGVLFVLAEMERSSSRYAALHLQNIVALPPSGRNSPCFVTRFCSLHPPPAALATLPLARPSRTRTQISRRSQNKRLFRFPHEGRADSFVSSRFAASHTGIETAHRAVSLVALLLVPFQISPSLKCKTKRTPAGVLFVLAEMERFELSRGDSPPTPLAGAPLRPLEYISVLRERPVASTHA